MFKGIWAQAQGWKVHGIAWGWIACTLIEKVAGLDIPDFDPGADWVNGVFIALGVSAGRSTIAAIVQSMIERKS